MKRPIGTDCAHPDSNPVRSRQSASKQGFKALIGNDPEPEDTGVTEQPEEGRGSEAVAGLPRVTARLVAGPCSLYRFYSETELLYIGITGAGSRQRFKGHQSDKQWWTRVRHIEVEHYATREEAEDQEAAQIQVLRPVFNIQHNTDPILEPTRDDESQHHRCTRCSASYVSHEEKPGLNLCVRCRRLVKARAEKRERGQGKLRSV